MSELKKLWKSRNSIANKNKMLLGRGFDTILGTEFGALQYGWNVSRLKKIDKKINDIRWYNRQNNRNERVSAFRGY